MTKFVGQWLPSVVLVAVGCVAACAEGLKEEVVEAELPGPAIVWRDFEKGQPAVNIILTEQKDEGQSPARGRMNFWHVRRPGWTPRLLNAVGTPPDLVLVPGVDASCDIYLGLRAVTPTMSFAIRLASEKEFTVITAPAALPGKHYDFEFFWKARVPMSGERIVVRALGKPVFLEYVKFIPYVRTRSLQRVAQGHVTILAERGRHFAFPGVAELANGDLLVLCREGDAHVCPRGRIVMTRSRDGGKTWSPRECLYDSPSDERDPAVLRLKDGTVLVSFNTWDSWRGAQALRARYPLETTRMEKEGWGKYSGSWTMFSRDNGRTWSQPRRSPVFSPHGPVVGPDEALYWIGERTKEGRTVVEIYRSADVGKTWEFYSEVAYCRPFGQPLTWEYWDEPNLLFLPDGKAIATFRVAVDGFVRQSYSSDNGKTWSWPIKLPVWGYPQHLLLLPDGRVLMSYGYRREPFGVRACLSRNGGRTYDLEHEIVLRREGASDDLGYPYSIPLRDGRVLTVYYYHPRDGDCMIEGVAYKP